MNWYDGIKYEIPESLDSVKKETLSKIPLIEQKKTIYNRLINASRFFSNPGLSPEQIKEGNNLLMSIVSEMITLDEEIMNKDINIIGTLEARVVEMKIGATLNDKVNDLDEPIDSKSVQFFTVEENESSVAVTPEDMWFFKSAKRLFNIDPNNIEIL